MPIHTVAPLKPPKPNGSASSFRTDDAKPGSSRHRAGHAELSACHAPREPVSVAKGRYLSP